MITQISNSLYQQLRAAFEEGLPTLDSPTVHLRKAAFEQFTTIGFPTSKHEEWRNTGIQSLLTGNFVLDSHLPGRVVNTVVAEIPGVDVYKIVLVNGVFRRDLSDVPSEKGVEILPMVDAMNTVAFNQHFAQYADRTDNPFVSINTALAKDGFFLHVADKCQVRKPFHIIHVSATAVSTFYQERNLIVLGKDAEAEVIESFITESESDQSLGNSVSEIIMESNAKLEHYFIQIAGSQSKFLNHIEITQRKHSVYN